MPGKAEQQSLRRWAKREWRLAEGKVVAPRLEKSAKHLLSAAREYRRGRIQSAKRLMVLATKALNGRWQDEP